MTDDNEPLVFLNGEYGPIGDAKVSVLDRGFLFGDGVYEVIPVYAGRLFRGVEHLIRLDNSLRDTRIINPYTQEQWLSIFDRLLQPFQQLDASIYLQVTRGVQAKRDHAFPKDLTPTVFAMGTPTQYATQAPQGVSAITMNDIRWDYCHIKAITLLANVLLRQKAVDQNCAEAILVKSGYVSEGAASNLFLVDSKGKLKTPPKDNTVLPGITRDLIIELADIHGLAHQECRIPQAELFSAKELWITSSTKEIVPIIKLNGKTVGEGSPGPVWAAMTAHFAEYKEKIRRGEVL